MSLNLVQFLTKQGKFSGKNLDLEKKSSGSSETVPETLDASKPLGNLAHNVGDPVKAKTLTAPVTGKSVHIDAPEEQKPSSVESNREVVNASISKPVQSFDKPAPKKPEMLHFSRVPHNVTEKIAALKEKYKDKDCGGAEEDSLGVCCEHCASGERKIKAIKRASALFKGDSGWQFMCGEADHDPRNQVVVELGEVLEKNSMLREYINSPVDSVFVLDELRTKIASEISEQTKLAFQRNSGVRYNGEVFSNSDDVALLNKLGYSINFDEYSALDLYSEQQNIYTYLEKVAGIPKEVSEAVDRGEAFSGEYLKDMGYNVPKGYEIKGDLVCPLEKEAAVELQKEASKTSRRILEILKASNPTTRQKIIKRLNEFNLARASKELFGPKTKAKIEELNIPVRQSRIHKTHGPDAPISKLVDRYAFPNKNIHAIREAERMNNFSGSLSEYDIENRFKDPSEIVRKVLQEAKTEYEPFTRKSIRNTLMYNENKPILAQYPINQEGLGEVFFTPHFAETSQGIRQFHLDRYLEDASNLEVRGRNRDWSKRLNYETVLNRENITDPSKKLQARYFIPVDKSAPKAIAAESLPSSSEGYMYKGGPLRNIREARRLKDVAQTEGMFYSGAPEVSAGYAGQNMFFQPANFEELRQYFGIERKKANSVAANLENYFKPQAGIENNPTFGVGLALHLRHLGKKLGLVKAAHELKSTNIKSVDYNKENKSLDVEFHSGGTYTYKDVPKSLFDRIRKVKSPGRFFHKHLKKDNKFEYNKLEKEAYDPNVTQGMGQSSAFLGGGNAFEKAFVGTLDKAKALFQRNYGSEGLKETGQSFKNLGKQLSQGNVGDAIVNFGQQWDTHPEWASGMFAAGLVPTPASPALELGAYGGNVISSLGRNIVAPYQQYQKDLANYNAQNQTANQPTPARIGQQPFGQSMINASTTNVTPISEQTNAPRAPQLGEYISPVKALVDTVPFARKIPGVSRYLKNVGMYNPTDYVGEAHKLVTSPENFNSPGTAIKVVAKQGLGGVRGGALEVASKTTQNINKQNTNVSQPNNTTPVNTAPAMANTPAGLTQPPVYDANNTIPINTTPVNTTSISNANNTIPINTTPVNTTSINTTPQKITGNQNINIPQPNNLTAETNSSQNNTTQSQPTTKQGEIAHSYNRLEKSASPASRRVMHKPSFKSLLKAADYQWYMSKPLSERLTAGRPYPFSYLTGETKELVDAVKNRDWENFKEEIGDTSFGAQMLLAQATGLNHPVYADLSKAWAREKVWKDMFGEKGGTYHPKHMQGGSNYAKASKIIKAFQSAGIKVDQKEAERLANKYTGGKMEKEI